MNHAIEINVAGFAQSDEAIERIVGEALDRFAVHVGKTWAEAIYATDLSDAEKYEYAKTLRIERVGPLHSRVIADYKNADRLEIDRPARDLKDMLLTSTKTRQGPHGKYLVIPFRHNTPGNTAHAPAMPPEIYAIARELKPSTVTGQTTRVSASGHTVPQSIYQWGDGSTPDHPEKWRLNFRDESTWLRAPNASRNYQGMVRFDTSTGGGKSSAYLTFRVMSESQTGKWLIAAKPGLHIVDDVVRQAEQDAESMFPELLDR